METNFFATIAPLLGAMNLTFTVAQGKDDQLIVSVLPKLNVNDNTANNVTPLIIRGTVEELDKEFFDAIQKPMENISGISSNIKQFEENNVKIANENAAAKAAKEKQKKNKKKVEDLIKESKAFAENKEYDKARDTLDKAAKIIPDSKELAKAYTELSEIKGAGAQHSMFGNDPEPIEESDAELEKESNRIEHGLTDEHIEVIQEERDQKWNINNSGH